ncbi:unnamed protein product, partial [Mesorhabditis spiculigera]
MELIDAIEIPRVSGVFLRQGPRPPQMGSLVLMGHHLIFAPQVETPQGAGETNKDEFCLLHRAIDRVVCEPKSRDPNVKGGFLTLKCKNFMICVFEVPDFEECTLAARTIETLSNLNGFSLDYPFFYRAPFTVLDDGWNAFDVETEFSRISLCAPDLYRISEVNKDFKVCTSYPEKVVVPRGIGDDYLRISATFRDGSRFPVLAYFHKPTKSPVIRCSQPLIGPTNRRCKEDETILNAFLRDSRGIIIDTRGKQQAALSKAKGGGAESQQFYSQWRYFNCATPRIKDLHDSLAKMVDVCLDRSVSSDRWMSKIGSAGWLSSVADYLNAAANVAQCVACEGSSEVPVVVHGGEGVDSTLFATALAQILLDPDARTIRGFESVIEREWISGGHPFGLRNAHSAFAEGAITGPYESPVFLAFLDCVWQMCAQFPHSFEFTENFLLDLFEHSYASEFGSFLGNNEMEKFKHNVKKHTVSLWSYVNNPEILKGYVNTLYEPNESVLWPSVSPQSIQIWERLFLRWQRDWSEVNAIREAAAQWRLKERQLESKALSLRRQLIELTREAHLANGVAAVQLG